MAPSGTSTPKKFLPPAVLAACLAVIVLIGFLLYRRSHPAAPPAASPFKTMVDRGLSDADKAMLQKKIDDQLAAIDATEKSGKHDITQYLLLGNLYYEIGDLAKSEDAYQAILKTNPNDAPSLENLGQDQLESGDYAGAELSWEAAMKSEPDEDYFIRIADLIDQHLPNQRASIGPLLDNAVATLGQTSGLLYRLGEWYEENGQYEEAMSHYQVAYQLSGKDASIKQTMDALQAKISLQGK